MVDVWKELGKAVGRALKPLAEMATAVWKSLEDAAGDMAEGFFKGAKDVAAAVGPVVTPAMSGLIEEITETLKPDSPPEEVKKAAEKLTEALLEALAKLVPEKGESPPKLEELLAAVGGIVAANVGLFVGGQAGAMALDAVHPIKALGFRQAVSDVMLSFDMPAMIGPTLQAPIWAGVIAPLRMRMSQKFPYMIPGTGVLAGLRAAGIVEEKDYVEAMSFHALDETWAGRMREGEERMPGFAELRTMVHRGVTTVEDARAALERLRVRGDFIDAYLEVVPSIPSVSDLVRFAVREAFPDAETFEEHYAKMTEWIGRIGFSTYFAEAFWTAHWIIPTTRQADDLLHRGIITEAEHTALYIINDVRPTDIPNLRKLTWSLPGRIDARWLYRWGEIDVEGLRDLLIKGGLDPEYADEVAMATARNQWRSEINRLRDNAKRDHAKGYISTDQLRANLMALGLPATWVEYHVEDAVADRERELKDDKVNALGDAWLKDMISDDELEIRLATIIVDPGALEAELERLYIRRYKKPKPPQETEAEKALKELQKYRISYAILAFKKYAIERDGLVDRLIDAGVDPAVAEARADVETLRRPIARPTEAEIAREKERLRLQSIEERTAIEEFRKELIGADALLDRLRAAEYSEAMATAITQLEIVRVYKPPVPPPPPVIPVVALGVLRKAYREEVITEADFRRELTERRYSPEDIEVMVALERRVIEERHREVPEKIPEVPLSTLRAAFREGIISEEELTAELEARRYTPEDIELLLEVERARIPAPVVPEVSEATLRRAFRDEVIDEAALRAELERRGYSPDDVDMIVAIESQVIEKRHQEVPVKMRIVSEATLRAAFREEIISEAALRGELEARNYGPGDIDLIVALERKRVLDELARAVEKPRTVSVGILRAAFRRTIISEELLRGELEARLYGPEDVDLIVALEKTKMAEEAA